jgi:hypothetical protein
MLWHSLCSFLGFSGRCCSYSQPNFPAVSGSYLPGFSGRICSYWQPNFPAVSGTCRDFPAVSAVTGSRIFQLYLWVTCRYFLALPFLAPEGQDFLAVSVVSGHDFPAIAFLAWVI